MSTQDKAEAVADMLSGKPYTGRKYRILQRETRELDYGVPVSPRAARPYKWITRYMVQRRRWRFFWTDINDSLSSLESAYETIRDDIASQQYKEERRRRGRWQKLEVL